MTPEQQDDPGAAMTPERPRGLRVGVTAEQLFAPTPGGIGRYVEQLAARLPALAAREYGTVGFITARHDRAQLARAGLPPEATTTLRLPGRLTNQAWVRLRQPPLPARLRRHLDLVHATSLAVPPAGRLPLVVTVHDLAFRHHPETFPPRGRRWHERAVAAAVGDAARLLVPSAATAADLTDLYGVEPERITVTPLGVERGEPDLPAARRRLADIGVAGPFVLAVGTLEPRKNLPRLARAFARAALPGHSLVVAGPSGWGPAFQPGAADAARVRLAGRVPEGTLHGLYALADALAYPSLYEGFGLPVLEAMAHGTPVLTSDRGSLPEVAGDAALLVDPASTEAITAGLERLVSYSTLREKLSAAGRARAATFTWAATAEVTWAAYREVASG